LKAYIGFLGNPLLGKSRTTERADWVLLRRDGAFDVPKSNPNSEERRLRRPSRMERFDQKGLI